MYTAEDPGARFGPGRQRGRLSSGYAAHMTQSVGLGRSKKKKRNAQIYPGFLIVGVVQLAAIASSRAVKESGIW